VVVRLPSEGEEPLIKRVVGLPGETVEIREGYVYIDGRLLEEPLISEPTRAMGHEQTVVPPLHVFVLGDNRNHSNDSRSFGPVQIENIVGRAWVSYWPLEDVRVIR
jgi:signal peptidase I